MTLAPMCFWVVCGLASLTFGPLQRQLDCDSLLLNPPPCIGVQVCLPCNYLESVHPSRPPPVLSRYTQQCAQAGEASMPYRSRPRNSGGSSSSSSSSSSTRLLLLLLGVAVGVTTLLYGFSWESRLGPGGSTTTTAPVQLVKKPPRTCVWRTFC